MIYIQKRSEIKTLRQKNLFKHTSVSLLHTDTIQ